MGLIKSFGDKIGKLFAGDAPAQKRVVSGPIHQRSMRETAALGGVNSDWSLGAGTLSTDSEIWQNIFVLRARMRDLFRTNPYFQVYKRQLCSNVFGDKGIMLRMKIQETEDRVIHTAGEKWVLLAHERRVNRLREWAGNKTGHKLEVYRAFHLADRMDRASMDDILRGTAMIQVGAPDLYANKLIESRWNEWQKKEFCDIRHVRNYGMMRRLRLISACRDGDFFFHRVKDPKINKFGFALQMVNSEWCDFFYNTTLPNGNEVRMGIEYRKGTYGIQEAVAYYFLRRQPNDWQFSIPGAFNFSSGNLHDRVPAEEIIHYVMTDDADQTRSAPWGISTISKIRQLDEAEQAEVVAMRAAACKMGWFTSTLVPEGGENFIPPDPMKMQDFKLEPGSMQGVPYGIGVETFDPNHPNANIPEFRKCMLRSFCSAMAGASYSIIGSDYEAINFSAGRLDRLAMTGDWKLLQQDDIDIGERPIFEDFLEMGLITGAIPLPLAKKDKFNKPVFQGRRWEGVDPQKEITANALAVANKFTSRQRVVAEGGEDFEEIIFELAEEEMMLEELGMSSAMTVEGVKPAAAAEDLADEEEPPTGQPGAAKPASGKPKKPAAKKALVRP